MAFTFLHGGHSRVSCTLVLLICWGTKIGIFVDKVELFWHSSKTKCKSFQHHVYFHHQHNSPIYHGFCDSTWKKEVGRRKESGQAGQVRISSWEAGKADSHLVGQFWEWRWIKLTNRQLAPVGRSSWNGRRIDRVKVVSEDKGRCHLKFGIISVGNSWNY